jgi:RNA polymerase sigma factor (sigma-70 family)
MGIRGGEGEPDLGDWERFHAYCDGVIVTALERQPIQPADREDCRQEIWADLLASRVSRFRGGSLAAWLTTLARNKAIDTIRRARRQPMGSAIESLERAAAVTPAPCPVDEQVSTVRLALAELERRIEQRSYAVFFLRWFEHQSFAQIAGALSLTPEQARARHHRTKAVFRNIVEKHVVRGEARG